MHFSLASAKGALREINFFYFCMDGVASDATELLIVRHSCGKDAASLFRLYEARQLFN
jgi:hypothetical protein